MSCRVQRSGDYSLATILLLLISYSSRCILINILCVLNRGHSITVQIQTSSLKTHVCKFFGVVS